MWAAVVCHVQRKKPKRWSTSNKSLNGDILCKTYCKHQFQKRIHPLVSLPGTENVLKRLYLNFCWTEDFLPCNHSYLCKDPPFSSSCFTCMWLSGLPPCMIPNLFRAGESGVFRVQLCSILGGLFFNPSAFFLKYILSLRRQETMLTWGKKSITPL